MKKLIALFLLAGTFVASAGEGFVGPAVEGVYQLDASNKKLGATIVVMNTLTEHGVVISFPDGRNGYPKHIFSATQIKTEGSEWTTLEALSFGSAAADIELTLNSRAGTLSGWFRDPRLEADVKLIGVLLHSTAKYYKEGNGTVPMHFAQGSFRQENHPPGWLSTYKSLSAPDLWRAILQLDVGVSAQFQYGRADLKRRVLELVSHHTNTNHFLKWTMAIEANEETEESSLRGLGFDTSYGVAYDLDLKKK